MTLQLQNKQDDLRMCLDACENKMKEIYERSRTTQTKDQIEILQEIFRLAREKERLQQQYNGVIFAIQNHAVNYSKKK